MAESGKLPDARAEAKQAPQAHFGHALLDGVKLVEQGIGMLDQGLRGFQGTFGTLHGEVVTHDVSRSERDDFPSTEAVPVAHQQHEPVAFIVLFGFEKQGVKFVSRQMLHLEPPFNSRYTADYATKSVTGMWIPETGVPN